VKIPDSIRIGGVEYAVQFKENIRHDNVYCYGNISFDDCEIRLSSTDGTAHQKQCTTLLHEILHGIIHNAGLELDGDIEEKAVDVLSMGLYQVLQDNGGRLFDIVQEASLRKKIYEDLMKKEI